ncbi:hypothetical protein TNCV_3821231 [Trichonephila clavipes]|nr:hypothetical protein TNCV_3821231 [Trichonephila clavipes]
MGHAVIYLPRLHVSAPHRKGLRMIQGNRFNSIFGAPNNVSSWLTNVCEVLYRQCSIAVFKWFYLDYRGIQAEVRGHA